LPVTVYFDRVEESHIRDAYTERHGVGYTHRPAVDRSGFVIGERP
jgi:hypothetical protein